MQMKNKTSEFWKNRSKLQKILMVSALAAIIIIGIIISVFASNSKMAPLYKDLSAEEAGQIKKELDAKKVPNELSNGGTVISVPEDQVDSLKVQMAAEGLPKTGSIDYSFFGQNAGFGLTDNEFDMVKVKATQTELSNLINEMDGIKNSKVMITLCLSVRSNLQHLHQSFCRFNRVIHLIKAKSTDYIIWYLKACQT
ncbi:hypothetical protein BSMD_025100 [Bacillus subtilis Miyagi-4]|nr:hypothetical protein BSNT_08132 [Bacillus subtilis subsp. natto BEST195]GAK80598.1 hypothetical protein BSMD_025100 [Bacillus subtilis Miyagi-4]